MASVETCFVLVLDTINGDASLGLGGGCKLQVATSADLALLEAAVETGGNLNMLSLFHLRTEPFELSFQGTL